MVFAAILTDESVVTSRAPSAGGDSNPTGWICGYGGDSSAVEDQIAAL